MAEKSIKSRLVNKHDVEENWDKATSFIPLLGEIIIYDVDSSYDYERMKIGDGVTAVNVLPFIDNTLTELIDTKADKSQGVYYIEGSGTTDTTNKVATWTGSHSDITSYYSGLAILYKIGTAGSTSTTLNINNLGAVQVVRNVTTAISTAYAINAIVLLIYTTDSSGTSYWKVADYDSNTKTTTGTSNKTSTKMFIVGGTSQSSSTTTYSNKNIYIGTDNCLYSNGEKVATADEVTAVSDLVGDTSVATQITNAIASKADVDHTHPISELTDLSGATVNHASTSDEATHAATADTANSVAWDDITDKPSTYTPATHSHTISNVTNLQTSLDAKVPTSRTVNGQALSANITLSASDVGADASGSASSALASAKDYTDTEIAEWVGDETVSEQITSAIASKADSNHTHSSYVNQNAFSNVAVGSTTVAADSATDTLTLVAGSNVVLTPDATNDKITIAATDTVYTHPSYTARTGVPTANQTPSFGGTFSVSQPVSDATGHITAINSRTVTIPSTAATTSVAGLMSAADKTKLNGIATGATKVTVDSALSSTSTNPVQNKVVNTAISNLNTLVGDTAVSEQIATAIDGITLSSLGVTATAAELNKLDGVTATTAELNYVDGVTSNIQTQLNSKAASSHGTHVTYSTTTPAAAGTASVGSATTVARSDHVHPAQTTISGNAGSATKLATARTISLTGDVTGSVSFDGSGDVSITATVTDDSHNHTIANVDGLQSALDDKAASSHTHSDLSSSISTLNTLVGDTAVSEQINEAIADKADIAAGEYTATASSSDGIAYTATVPGITALTAGASFIMIPGKVSASTTPTLNVNSLGAKNIRRRLSNLATAVQAGYTTTWLAVNMPFRVVYDGTQWVVEGQTKPVSADLYGAVPVNKGGTGATTAAAALTNLGAASIDDLNNYYTKDEIKTIRAARNLLDNSDFRHTVDQRGVLGSTADEYIIDRWVARIGGIIHSCDDTGLRLSSSSTDNVGIYQKLAGGSDLNGKTVTAALCTSDGEIIVTTGTLPSSFPTTWTSYSSNTNGEVTISIVNIGDTSGYSHAVYISRVQTITSDVTVRWVALYEGEYTTDTLPPYVSNGYWAELRECLRYYQKTNGYGYGYANSTSTVKLIVNTSVGMRVVPSIVGNPTYTVRGNGQSHSVTECEVQTGGGGISSTIYLILTDSSAPFTTNQALIGYCTSSFILSADL